MDEKDRIITAIYNDTRARARCVTALSCLAPCSTLPPPITLPIYLFFRANRARIQLERQLRQQSRTEPSPPPEGPRIVPQDTSS